MNSTRPRHKSKAINPHESSNGCWQDAEELRWAVRHWAVRMNVRAPQLHLRSMQTKWASLSMHGRLTLNTDVLALPRELGEYIIVHELAHLLAPNHGRVFKLFLDAFMPDWKERQSRLRSLETGK